MYRLEECGEKCVYITGAAAAAEELFDIILMHVQRLLLFTKKMSKNQQHTHMHTTEIKRMLVKDGYKLLLLRFLLTLACASFSN